MPSSMELILLFLYFLVLVFILAAWDKVRARMGKRVGHQKSKMRYSPTVYWSRDYWSNRPVPGVKKELKRNVQDEDFGIDTGSRTQGELVVQESDNRRWNVQWPEGTFTDLVNPHELVRQYEPHSIEPRPDRGFLFPPRPQAHARVSERGARLEQRGYIPPDEVSMEPVAHAKSLLKTFEMGSPLMFLASSPFIVWLWSIALRYLIAFIPWFEPIYVPAMVLIIVLFAYITIRSFISQATKEVREANATIYLYDGERPNERHYRYAGDTPGWLESKPYWVFRYLFTWPKELTVKKSWPLIHIPLDLERADVWVDAATGRVEWIVSDYHWRELWYKAEKNLSRILLWILPNFHTPHPLTIETEGKGEPKGLYIWGHPLNQTWDNHLEKHTFLHPEYWIARQFGVTYLPGNVIIETLAELWWDHWRYPLGADSNSYANGECYPAVGEQPPSPGAGRVPGVVVKRLGRDREGVYLVDCQDGHERVCRTEDMPRFMGRVILSEGDVVSVSPSDSQPDTRGEIVWEYRESQVELLRKYGLLTL